MSKPALPIAEEGCLALYLKEIGKWNPELRNGIDSGCKDT
jgi:hypothetical protein